MSSDRQPVLEPFRQSHGRQIRGASIEPVLLVPRDIRQVESRSHTPHRTDQRFGKWLRSFETAPLDPSDHIEIARRSDELPLQQESARPDDDEVKAQPLLREDLPEDFEATLDW